MILYVAADNFNMLPEEDSITIDWQIDANVSKCFILKVLCF